MIYSHHVRVAERWRVGRVFLAGDAAHAMPPWIGQGMSAGVRDVANLCWKLAAVLRGQAPESLLDSYQCRTQAARAEVTRRAVLTGRIITERNPAWPPGAQPLVRGLSRLPGVLNAFQKMCWIPDARYKSGFLALGQTARSAGRSLSRGWSTIRVPPYVLTNHRGPLGSAAHRRTAIGRASMDRCGSSGYSDHRADARYDGCRARERRPSWCGRTASSTPQPNPAQAFATACRLHPIPPDNDWTRA